MSATAPRSALGLTVDTLHEAARSMRERAGSAQQPTDGSAWIVDHANRFAYPHEVYSGPIGRESHDVASATDGATATHIASWHPTVALAVANWLDRTARNLPVGDNGGPAVLPGSTYEAAVAVARAYLGVSA